MGGALKQLVNECRHMLPRRQIAHLRLYDLSGVADQFKVNMKRDVVGVRDRKPLSENRSWCRQKMPCLPSGIAIGTPAFAEQIADCVEFREHRASKRHRRM